jgi:putative ABC transport system permease protein
VGVAADARYRELTRDWLTVYFPAKQFFFFSPGVIVVRTAAEPEMLLTSLRQAVQAAAPAAAVHSVGTMEQLTSAEVARQRTAVIIATAFAFMAIFVAAVGVYAVSSYEVANRTRELAVRVAVGASPAQILGGALRQSLVLGLGGAVIGLLLASLVTRFLAAMLFEVTHLDAASFVAAGAGLLAIVVLASVGPTRRAARVDPALLLRSE